MHSKNALQVLAAVSVLFFTFAVAAPPVDVVQEEFDRFVDQIGNGMLKVGRPTTILFQPGDSDDKLIVRGANRLNRHPAPLKECHILKKEYVGPDQFQALLRRKMPLSPPIDQPSGIPSTKSDNTTYLIAVLDTDQGHKIIAIGPAHSGGTDRWARIYNCDAVFSSPMNGGTPLIRGNPPNPVSRSMGF